MINATLSTDDSAMGRLTPEDVCICEIHLFLNVTDGYTYYFTVRILVQSKSPVLSDRQPSC